MLARSFSLLVWAVLAGSAVYWAFKLFVTPLEAPAHTQPTTMSAPASADLTRLFGVEAAPVVVAAVEPAPDTRFQLVGVVAPRVSANGPANLGQGVALIAVDGKPAKAFRVGAVVDGDMVLQSVRQRGANLGRRGAEPSAKLQLVPVPVAATGSLPGAVSNVVPVNTSTNPSPVPNPITNPPRPGSLPRPFTPSSTPPSGVAQPMPDSPAPMADALRRAAQQNQQLQPSPN